jgi:hypothetical protein
MTAGCAPSSPGPAAGPAGPEVRWVRKPGGRVTVEVVGADSEALSALALPQVRREDWPSFLSVTVADGTRAGGAKRTPMLGTYRVTRDVITFEPRFPLEPGLRYRAEFDPARLRAVAAELSGRAGRRIDLKTPDVGSVAVEFSLPPPRSEPTTTVTAVYPSGDRLPENLLKFYLHFSAPMSRGEAYERVHLLDGSGKPIDLPFLELGEELWDPEGKRFTLLFDPGRIKSGLKPREEAGPVLEAGKPYTLVIDRDWHDARGNPLRDSFRKTFRAGPADKASPDPRAWKIHAPKSGTRDPLALILPEPLDHAMLRRTITVTGPSGRTVPGEVAIDSHETRWLFTPERRWEPGAYSLIADTSLEDLAGNGIGRPFEVDVFRKVERRENLETITLRFRIGN